MKINKASHRLFGGAISSLSDSEVESESDNDSTMSSTTTELENNTEQLKNSWSTPLRIQISENLVTTDFQPMELVNRPKRTKSDESDDLESYNPDKRFLPPISPTYSPSNEQVSPTYVPNDT